MSATPELVYKVTENRTVRLYNLLHDRQHKMGTCAFCKKNCYSKAYFCNDAFLAIVNENGKIAYMSDCLYEYFKDMESEILEWITE